MVDKEKNDGPAKTGADSADDTLWSKAKLWLADTGKQLAVAILIVLVLRSSIIEPYKIPSGSMIPTLFIGDHIFVNKLAYGLKVPFSDNFAEKPIFLTDHSVPARGDVIVFKYPKDESINYIKRVVGLPGDVISIRNKLLFINDKRVDESALADPAMLEGIETDFDRATLSLFLADMEGKKHPVLHDGNTFHNSDFGPYTVPANSLFAMGDNRDRSSDSRSWGIVPVENVKGKAMFIWLNVMLNFQDSFQFRFRPTRIAKWIN